MNHDNPASKSKIKLFSIIISTAILNKYNNWSFEKLNNYVFSVISEDNRYRKNPMGFPVFQKDIINQFYCLTNIDAHLKKKLLSFDIVETINILARGIEYSDLTVRSKELVKDFGGKALTHSGDIKNEINKLEIKFTKINRSANLSKYDHADLMSDLFCEIIRIHPFPDGNGRTARFLIQLLTQKWGYNYIIIPKYRNDRKWKVALDNGVKGDRFLMTQFFDSHLRVNEEYS